MLVRRDAVVEIELRRREVPHRYHEVPLDPFRALWLRERELAGGNAVGPVGEVLERCVEAHVTEAERHVAHRLARLRPARPLLEAIAFLPELIGHDTDAVAAERMARLAGILHRVDPGFLRLDVG